MVSAKLCTKLRVAVYFALAQLSENERLIMKLMTMGYEGTTSRQFFALLLENKVQTIVDVRELPISRKAGFSKAALVLTASDYNMNYIHVPALGCPKEIRHDYRADDDWTRYTRRFMTYLNTQRVAINELVELVKRERCCLICFEADPNFCHRSFVAQRVATVVGSSFVVVHITALTPEKVANLHPAPA